MISDYELKDGAQAFARTLRVPGGRTSFDYAVRQHIAWFDCALKRGLTWRGIIGLLHGEGVTRDDGRALSRGHLSSVYWRQMQATRQVEPSARDHQPGPCRPIAEVKKANAAAHTHEPRSSVAQAGLAKPAPPSPVAETGDVRAFMQRALRLRRSSHDE